jgi:uncharacterized protein (TIGR03437 family)
MRKDVGFVFRFFCVAFVLILAGLAQSIVVSPSSLTFTGVADSATPSPAQTVQVTASDGSKIPFTVSVYSVPPGIIALNAGFQVSPSSGTTPATVTIGFLPSSIVLNNPKGQWPLILAETLLFSSGPFSDNPASLPVSATVSQPFPPAVTAVVSQASQLPTVSPGELISIKGSSLGPGQAVSGYTCSSGEFARCYYPSLIGGTSLTINGVAAPIISAGPTSVDAIVPYSVSGPLANIILTHYGQASASVGVPLSDTSPGIFANSITNNDFSLNGPTAPEPAGSVVSFKATGFGMWNQTGLDPANIPAESLLPAAPIGLTIGGLSAQILSQAPAPNVVGQLEVRAAIPPGLAAGPQPLVLTAGNNSNSLQNVSVYIGEAAPLIRNLTNGASFVGATVSPGELVSVFGGFRSPNLTMITFNGLSAPILYAGIFQINTVIPFEVAGETSVMAVATVDGMNSAPFAVALTDTSPAIFMGGILNDDNSLNSASNAATAGTVVQMFGTGAGVWKPALADGSIVPLTPPFPVPSAKVSLTIGGLPAQIQYAGAAPGLIAGVLQVNAVIPAGLAAGRQSVVMSVGENDSSHAPMAVFVK